MKLYNFEFKILVPTQKKKKKMRQKNKLLGKL